MKYFLQRPGLSIWAPPTCDRIYTTFRTDRRRHGSKWLFLNTRVTRARSPMCQESIHLRMPSLQPSGSEPFRRSLRPPSWTPIYRAPFRESRCIRLSDRLLLTIFFPGSKFFRHESGRRVKERDGEEG